MQKFWQWYEKNYTFNIGLVAGLFLLQIIHLIWLTGFVVAERLLGYPLFEFKGIWQTIIILTDYTEIPALLTTSLVYINELRKIYQWKSLLFLIFINIQWLHLFWITDEFILQSFSGITILPIWLAWIAILIDYLELPVIVETIKRFLASALKNQIKPAE